jgi:hypothetical protein
LIAIQMPVGSAEIDCPIDPIAQLIIAGEGLFGVGRSNCGGGRDPSALRSGVAAAGQADKRNG